MIAICFCLLVLAAIVNAIDGNLVKVPDPIYLPIGLLGLLGFTGMIGYFLWQVIKLLWSVFP